MKVTKRVTKKEIIRRVNKLTCVLGNYDMVREAKA